MTVPPPDEAERLAWLRLIRTDGVGPVTFHALLGRYGSASAALDALPGIGRRTGRTLRPSAVAAANAELEALDRLGGRFVALPDPGYPAWLRQIDGAPPLLAVRGSPEVFARPAIAIIGSRNASVAGRKMAAILARGIGEEGLVVASGLARGIDAAAHEAALPTGTIAVFAGGIDRVYPPENAMLAEAIASGGGAIVTEAPLGLEPRARDFPRRNRIVSGLSLGVVVVEAAERSGTLITARFAGEQGRIVFAVPGSPLDPRAAGTNRLLKDGAILTTEAADVLGVVAPMIGAPAPAPTAPALPLFEAEAEPTDRILGLVLEALGPSPMAIDEIVRFTGLAVGEVQMALLELDLARRIERHAGQRVSLA
ncbi:MAG: DNA-processing protein DprA [Bauldia sp.]|nr:DNA-processing protein DprA [Bauldia sp.]